jgi:hypothetical protein
MRGMPNSPAQPHGRRDVQFTVRLTGAEAAALHELRVALGAELADIPPTRSEAVGALALAASDPRVRAALVAHLAETDRKAAAS